MKKTSETPGKYMEVADLLNNILKDRQKKNPKYSMRALARDLNTSPGRVSNILQGKALPGKIVRARIIDILAFDKKQTEHFNYLVNKNRHGRKDPRKRHLIGEKEYTLLPEWHHYAILNILQTTNHQTDPKWIAKRLNISADMAADSLDKLTLAGLLAKNKDGYKVTHSHLASRSDIPSSALRKYNKQMIEKSLESLENDPIEIRDITSLIVPSNPMNLYKVKLLAREFRRQVAELFEEGEKTEVYNVCLQIYPVTKHQ